MNAILIGYARCSTDKRDLEANQQILLGLGVPADQIHLDRAYSGTKRNRPGLGRALAAARAGDTREGMAITKAKGRLKGRAPKLSADRQAHLLKLHAAGEHTIAELAELFEVSRPTVYRILYRAQPETTAA